MSYALGVKTIKRLCLEQNPMAWQRAKLSAVLFKPYEVPVFEWVDQHLKQYHALPQVETLTAMFADAIQVEIPEPATYYVKMLENRYFYESINAANLDAQTILKANQDDHEKALEVLKQCTRVITEQKYRLRILDVAKEAPKLVMTAYYALGNESVASFGWPYMDHQSGGVMAGEVISLVGRPAVGKSWLMLWSALHNWRQNKMNILFVSMEMMTLPIAQRIAALYTNQNIQQLKVSGYSDKTLKKFSTGLQGMKLEKAKFFVIDGNLAANVEDIFIMAEMLECKLVFVDGAYLLRHKNVRLDRYTRAAENVELIKRYCTDNDMTVFCSWQFNRVASQKQKKGTGEQGDLEDIGYTDAIGQISSIALSLFQEDSIETMKERKVKVMKGRNGEVGQFSIAWSFTDMNFQQVDPPLDQVKKEMQDLEWL